MRARIVLIAIALAVLACAGLGPEDARSIEPYQGGGVACLLAAQPAPDADQPAIVRAAANAPATAQSHLDFEARRHVLPALDVSTAWRQAPVEPANDSSRPRSFPLLI